MPSQSPFRIEPTKDERAILRKRAGAHTAPHWEVVWAKIVLVASEKGPPTRRSPRDFTPAPRRSVSGLSAFMRRDWVDWRIGPALADRRSFPPEARTEVKALACELPATSGVPLSRWSAAEVAREAMARGLVAKISGATLWRWLSEDAIRPFYHRSWIFPRDPDFADKAGRVLDLYEGRWEGEALGEGESM